MNLDKESAFDRRIRRKAIIGRVEFMQKHDACLAFYTKCGCYYGEYDAVKHVIGCEVCSK